MRIRLIPAFAALTLLLTGCDQYVARKLGGKITASIPQGTQLVSLSWKEDSVWILYYEPKTNTCFYKESAALDMMEGVVELPNCNPVGLPLSK